MNGVEEPPGQDVVLGAAGRGHRRRPVHPVRHLRGRLPVQLDRHRRGHRPARAGQDVHRLLAVLGLLPAGRAPLRGPVAAVDRRRTAPTAGRGRRRWCGPTPPTTTGRSPAARPATDSARCSTPTRSGPARGPTTPRTAGWSSALLIAALAGGEIDGALVTRPSDDPDEPWKGVAHLATTAKEITEAAGSYYNQTMALAELDLSTLRPAGQAADRGGRHALRDPGHPGHAVAAVAHRSPPDRLRWS